MNNDISQAAFLISQSVCAYARIEGMKAENQSRIQRGENIAYTEKDFVDIPRIFGLDSNDAIQTLRGE